jgi:hypothetical protein
MSTSQTILTLEKTIKEAYLPAWQNQLGVEPSALLAKIKKVPLTGNKIVTTAPIGLNGGFGFGNEGIGTPSAGALQYEKFVTEAKDMFVNICISDKAIKLATTNKGSMVDALSEEMKSSYATAKWNVGRALFGDGTGMLATFAEVEVAANSITVNDTSKLKEGLFIDFYATGGSTAVTSRRIKSINRATKVVTFDGTATTLDEGFVTVQKSFNNEITGLGAIFDDSITSLYGNVKANNDFIKPIVVDAQADIDDEIITKALRQSTRDKNGAVDMFLAGDTAFDAYVTYLKVHNIRYESTDLTLRGGFKAIKFTFSDREVAIVNEQFVPVAEMWGVDTAALEFHHMDWSFVQKDGGIFNLLADTSIFRALLANYGELICKNPGACIRIHNIA